MDAPSSIKPAAAYSIGDVVHWLMNETRDQRFIDNHFRRAVHAASSALAFPSSARRCIS